MSEKYWDWGEDGFESLRGCVQERCGLYQYLFNIAWRTLKQGKVVLLTCGVTSREPHPVPIHEQSNFQFPTSTNPTTNQSTPLKPTSISYNPFNTFIPFQLCPFQNLMSNSLLFIWNDSIRSIFE